jgi:hypothetical protein
MLQNQSYWKHAFHYWFPLCQLIIVFTGCTVIMVSSMSTMEFTLNLVRGKRKRNHCTNIFIILAVSNCSFVLSQVTYATSSVGRVLESPKSFSLPAYMPCLAFDKKQQAWLRELENSGVVADLKLINCSAHSVLECMATDCLCMSRQHDLL